jgi:hypothetical protein
LTFSPMLCDQAWSVKANGREPKSCLAEFSTLD